MSSETINIRGVDPDTAAMFKLMASVQGVSYAKFLTLCAGEYLAAHRDEIESKVRNMGRAS